MLPLPALMGSMGERAAYQRLTGGEKGQQVMEEGIARYPGPNLHHLLIG